MKRKLLLLVMFAASVVATLAFVNNVVVLVDWWRSFIAAGGNSAAMEPHHGCIGWLDWSAVDYSAVTTFIPMLGFWCMTAGLYRIVRRRRVRVEDFPFFRGSDQFNVALGLFGTLWGIIVIGYFDLTTVSMADLMQCLHTALFSTLMAVVWVFMIDRPLVRPLFARMLMSDDLAECDEDDLAAEVERLVSRLAAASDGFDRRMKQYEEASAARQSAYAESFSKSFRNYEEALEKRHKAYAESFEKRLAEYGAEFEARRKEYVEFFRRRIDELEKSANAEKSRADAANAKLAAVTNALR